MEANTTSIAELSNQTPPHKSIPIDEFGTDKTQATNSQFEVMLESYVEDLRKPSEDISRNSEVTMDSVAIEKEKLAKSPWAERSTNLSVEQPAGTQRSHDFDQALENLVKTYDHSVKVHVGLQLLHAGSSTLRHLVRQS